MIETRLSAEYDPVERHDLDRVEARQFAADAWPWHAYCACGWSNAIGARTRGEGRKWHQEHQDERLGIGS